MSDASLSVVILTMGDRPVELARCIESIRGQVAVDSEIIVVNNGGVIEGEVDADHILTLPMNLGIPGGRNAGAAVAKHALVAFIDDDGFLENSDALTLASAHFEVANIAVVGMRIVDETGQTSRRHVPRVGGKRAADSGLVAGFLGGASLLRKSAFEDVGAFDERFFYAMEETDLVWRLVGQDWQVYYEASARLQHPRTTPSRHAGHVERTARNRFWAAHKSLPLPIAVVHVAAWVTISSIRSHTPSAVISGTLEGWRTRGPNRSPMRWRSAWRLTRLGRPPII